MKVNINTPGITAAETAESSNTVTVTSITAPKITQVSEPPTNSSTKQKTTAVGTRSFRIWQKSIETYAAYLSSGAASM